MASDSKHLILLFVSMFDGSKSLPKYSDRLGYLLKMIVLLVVLVGVVLILVVVLFVSILAGVTGLGVADARNVVVAGLVILLATPPNIEEVEEVDKYNL